MTIIKRLSIALAGAAVAAIVGLGGAASAAPQWCIDMGGPPCKGGPGGGEEGAGNNLSLPAVLTDTTNFVVANWAPPTEPELGVHYSYGCAKEEASGAFSYPNTSCVDDLMNPTDYLEADDCVVIDAPCYGYDVSRIYWQKVLDNSWWADEDGIADPAYVDHIDWGDALEARSWTALSQIRVETQPYSSHIPGFDPSAGTCAAATTEPETDCRVGIQMWHVSGQGTSEQWGIRTDENSVSYNYDSPFQIIMTDRAQLNIAKMEPGTDECPQPGGGEDGEDHEAAVLQSAPALTTWTESGWEGACTWRDAPYSVELSVGGKYVYGYNWPMKTVNTESVCGPGWLKTGWWRLTFYAPNGEVVFDDASAPVTAPPAVPAEVRALPRTEFNEAIAALSDEEESEALYVPVVDSLNNLSYIDLCILAKDGGGAGGGSGGGGGGGGPGGGGGGGGPGGGGKH
jgi:hypothetical protein